MIREIQFRYEVIRGGVAVTELAATGAPSIRCTASAECKMSLSGEFMENPTVDWANDAIKPYMVLNGAKYPIGEYIITRAEERLARGVATRRIEAIDKGLILKQARAEKRISFLAGTPYTDAVQSFLVGNGIVKILVEPSDYVLPVDREDWEPGTEHIKIINELLAEINYDSLWFDLDGYARIQKKRELSAENISHTYESGEFSLISEEMTKTLDTYDAYNVFMAMVSSADYDDPIYAIAVNDNPLSPVSTVRRNGRRIVAPIERLNNIASPEALQEHVNNRAAQSLLSTEETQFYTAKMPTHQVGDIIALRHEHASGLYLETDWTLPLSIDGRMTHRAKRVIL